MDSQTDAAPVQLIQQQYVINLSKEDRMKSFYIISPEQWIPDEQVHQCQFKTKTTECHRTFDWINRKHHCRRYIFN